VPSRADDGSPAAADDPGMLTSYPRRTLLVVIAYETGLVVPGRAA
jgi:hypothetical protein